MRNTLAALSLLVTGIACGASLVSGSRPEGLAEIRPDAGTEPVLAADSPLLTPDDADAGLRVTPVVKAVQRAKDSVVSIYIADGARQRGRVLRADGQGSGVILDEGGLVITNWHVVAPAASAGDRFLVQVRLRDDRRFDAHVVSTSREDDLALLQLEMPEGETVEPVALGVSDSLMTGETVIAIGNPQGHANTVTVGVLSAEDRSITVRAPDGVMRRYSGLLQTDAAINQGNSGGALLDITGRLVGINNAMAMGSENIGFAIPVDTVRRVFQSVLLSSDHLMADAWLGMQVVEEDAGLVVADIDPNGPAARAGVRAGDVVTGANGEPVDSALDYTRQLLEARPGRRFGLELQRGQRHVRLDAVPLSHAAWELIRMVGLEVETVDRSGDPDAARDAAQALRAGGYRSRLQPRFVKITRVLPDGPADALGLEAGDILLGFRYSDGWRAYDVQYAGEQDLADKLRPFAGHSVLVYVLRDGKELEGRLYVRE